MLGQHLRTKIYQQCKKTTRLLMKLLLIQLKYRKSMHSTSKSSIMNNTTMHSKFKLSYVQLLGTVVAPISERILIKSMGYELTCGNSQSKRHNTGLWLQLKVIYTFADITFADFLTLTEKRCPITYYEQNMWDRFREKGPNAF